MHRCTFCERDFSPAHKYPTDCERDLKRRQVFALEDIVDHLETISRRSL